MLIIGLCILSVTEMNMDTSKLLQKMRLPNSVEFLVIDSQGQSQKPLTTPMEPFFTLRVIVKKLRKKNPR